jgi:hypothetical protein
MLQSAGPWRSAGSADFSYRRFSHENIVIRTRELDAGFNIPHHKYLSSNNHAGRGGYAVSLYAQSNNATNQQLTERPLESSQVVECQSLIVVDFCNPPFGKRLQLAIFFIKYIRLCAQGQNPEGASCSSPAERRVVAHVCSRRTAVFRLISDVTGRRINRPRQVIKRVNGSRTKTLLPTIYKIAFNQKSNAT